MDEGTPSGRLRLVAVDVTHVSHSKVERAAVNVGRRFFHINHDLRVACSKCEGNIGLRRLLLQCRRIVAIDEDGELIVERRGKTVTGHFLRGFYRDNLVVFIQLFLLKRIVQTQSGLLSRETCLAFRSQQVGRNCSLPEPDFIHSSSEMPVVAVVCICSGCFRDIGPSHTKEDRVGRELPDVRCADSQYTQTVDIDRCRTGATYVEHQMVPLAVA